MHTQMIDASPQHSDSKRLIEEYLLEDAHLGYLDSAAPKHFGRLHQIPKTAKLQTVSIIDTLSELARDGELGKTGSSAFSPLKGDFSHPAGVRIKRQSAAESATSSSSRTPVTRNLNGHRNCSASANNNGLFLEGPLEGGGGVGRRYAAAGRDRGGQSSSSGGASNARAAVPRQNDVFSRGINFDHERTLLDVSVVGNRRVHHPTVHCNPTPLSRYRGGTGGGGVDFNNSGGQPFFAESQVKPKGTRRSHPVVGQIRLANGHNSHSVRSQPTKQIIVSRSTACSSQSGSKSRWPPGSGGAAGAGAGSNRDKDMSRSCFSDSEIDVLDFTVHSSDGASGFSAKSKCPSNDCLDVDVAWASQRHLSLMPRDFLESELALARKPLPPKVEDFSTRVPRKHHVPEWIRTLFVTAKQGNVEMLKLTMVDMDSALVRNLSDPSGNNLWHLSAAHNQLACLQWLCLKFGDEGLYDENKSGQTPVILAVKFGNLSVVQWLLDHNPNYNATDSVDGNRSLLHYAAKYGQVPVLIWLLNSVPDGSKINLADTNGNTPLHLSAKHGHIECVKEIVLHCGDLTARNEAGLKPYDVALCGNKKACAEYLLSLEACVLLSTEQCQMGSDINRYKLKNAEAKKTIKDLFVLLGDSLTHQRDLLDSFKRIQREFHQKEEEADDHSAESEKGEERRNDNLHLEFHNTLNTELERWSSLVLPNDEAACRNIEERWKRTCRKTNRQMPSGKPDPLEIVKSQFAQIQCKANYYAALQNAEVASLSESSLDDSGDETYDLFKRQHKKLRNLPSRSRSSWLASTEPEYKPLPTLPPPPPAPPNTNNNNSTSSSLAIADRSTNNAAAEASSPPAIPSSAGGHRFFANSAIVARKTSEATVNKIVRKKKSSSGSSINATITKKNPTRTTTTTSSDDWELQFPQSDVDLRELFERNPELKQEGRTCSVLEVLEPSSSENEELTQLHKLPSKDSLDSESSCVSSSSFNKTSRQQNQQSASRNNNNNTTTPPFSDSKLNSKDSNGGGGEVRCCILPPKNNQMVAIIASKQVENAPPKRFSLSRSVSAMQKDNFGGSVNGLLSSNSSGILTTNTGGGAESITIQKGDFLDGNAVITATAKSSESKRKISTVSAPILGAGKSAKDNSFDNDIEESFITGNNSSNALLLSSPESEDRFRIESSPPPLLVESGINNNHPNSVGNGGGIKKKGFLLKFSLKNRWSSKQKQRSPKKSGESSGEETKTDVSSTNRHHREINAAQVVVVTSAPTLNAGAPTINAVNMSSAANNNNVSATTAGAGDSFSLYSGSSSHNYEHPPSDIEETDQPFEEASLSMEDINYVAPQKKMDRPERLLPPPPPTTRREPPPRPPLEKEAAVIAISNTPNTSATTNVPLPDILTTANLQSGEVESFKNHHHHRHRHQDGEGGSSGGGTGSREQESLSNTDRFCSSSDLSRLYGCSTGGKSDSRPPSSASRIESTMRMDDPMYKSISFPLSKMSSASTELLVTPDSSTAGRQSPAPSEVSKTESALSPPSDVSKTESQRHMNHLGRIEEILNVQQKNHHEGNNSNNCNNGASPKIVNMSLVVGQQQQQAASIVGDGSSCSQGNSEEREFENLPESHAQQFRQPGNTSKKRSINRPWYEVSDEEDILTPSRFKPLGNQSNSEDESHIIIS